MKESNQPFGKISQHATTSTNTPWIPSKAEQDKLKATSPARFLKAMMSARSSSSIKGRDSSTTSGEKAIESASQSLLHQIKEKIFDVDLVYGVRSNVNICFGLKEFQKKEDVLTISDEVSQELISLGFLIDQLQSNKLRKQDVSQKIAD